MGPEQPLPIPAEFNDVNDYIESLLNFTTSSWLLQTLCGGVHILDFYTRAPDLYSTILPKSWRDWFKGRDITDVLDLLMREDLKQFDASGDDSVRTWRGGPAPPEELLSYIREVRKHLLARDFPPPNSGLKPQKASLPRHIALGMKVKKVHEVDNFARYVDRLASEIAESGKDPITHLVDFGSGQNYLGRALAAPPYSKHIVAVESKQHNIEGAKNMDVLARLVPKPLVMRNKKEYRKQTGKVKKKPGVNGTPEGPQVDQKGQDENFPAYLSEGLLDGVTEAPNKKPVSVEVECNDEECVAVPASTTATVSSNTATSSIPTESADADGKTGQRTVTKNLQIYTEGQGSVQYVEHIIKDGDLAPVIDQVLDTSHVSDTDPTSTSTTILNPANLFTVPRTSTVNAMVISLHSCGNLVHHGLRSMLLSPHISAVAMVGCCYNLLTERLGPPTYKLPTLRENHPRLESASQAFDPHGFPMSERLANHPLPYQPPTQSGPPSDPRASQLNGDKLHDSLPQLKGIRLNITARMMAVQAPGNWGATESDLFFTRHFYRALLQRIFLDRGVISAPDPNDPNTTAASANGHTSRVNLPSGDDAEAALYSRGPGLSSNGKNAPLTIGTLRKFAYADFVSYVRAAIGKLLAPNSFCEIDPAFIAGKLEGLTDDEIRDYEEAYAERKMELSVMWSLMAFSAGVVEAVVVVDRWLWLKEQEEVERAWVEPVFEYGYSPRNLVVVGVKK